LVGDDFFKMLLDELLLTYEYVGRFSFIGFFHTLNAL